MTWITPPVVTAIKFLAGIISPARVAGTISLGLPPWKGKHMAKKGLLCVYCHDDIRQLLTNAHRYHKKERRADPNRPGINEAAVLCWSCHHGLLHQGIISWEEVKEAADATRAGIRRVTHDQVYRQIAADLDAGRWG